MLDQLVASARVAAGGGRGEVTEQQWIESRALIQVMVIVAARGEKFGEWLDLVSEYVTMERAMEANALVPSPLRV